MGQLLQTAQIDWRMVAGVSRCTAGESDGTHGGDCMTKSGACNVSSEFRDGSGWNGRFIQSSLR
jgi:hypothetical protein